MVLMRRVRVGRFLEALLRILAHRVEQAIAFAARVEHDERFLHELRHLLEHVFRRFGRKAAGEHGEPPEH